MMQIDEKAAPTRARGRPRAFDRDTALRGAMEAFWQNGFDGTSMQDLVTAMGINSPSIYAAFGSKEDLFRETVDLYANAEGSSSRCALQGPGSAKQAIRTMLTKNIEMFADRAMPRGCLIVLGAVHIGSQNPSLRAYVRDRRRDISDMVRQRLLRAATDGELAPDANVDALTALVITVLSGLSIQALDATPRQMLLDAVDIFIKSLPMAAER